MDNVDNKQQQLVRQFCFCKRESVSLMNSLGKVPLIICRNGEAAKRFSIRTGDKIKPLNCWYMYVCEKMEATKQLSRWKHVIQIYLKFFSKNQIRIIWCVHSNISMVTFTTPKSLSQLSLSRRMPHNNTFSKLLKNSTLCPGTMAVKHGKGVGIIDN